MRTLGIDLASQPAKTGLCTVDWDARFARVEAHSGLGTDDLFDALVCALVARAATLGLTIAPSPQDLPRARTEGWIHVPRRDALEQLVQPG